MCVECISTPISGSCIPNSYDKDADGCEVTPDGTLYSAYPGKKKEFFVPIDSKTSVQTRVDCANLCSLDKDCGSCFFNNSTLKCDLFAEQYVNPHIFKL